MQKKPATDFWNRFVNHKIEPLLLLAVILTALFFRSFNPNLVLFSNDGPLGAISVEANKQPGALTGVWSDLNVLGSNGGAGTINITSLLSWLLGPLYFAKFYVPLTLLILGVGAGMFFRALRFSPLTATLGAVAATLNMTYFTDAAWGVGPHEIAAGMNFVALALIVASTRETPWTVRWTRLALAGLCVGMNVMEAADIGALYSLVIAAFVFYKSWVDAEGSILKKSVSSVSRVAIVAGFAGFMGLQTVVSLIGTQVQGIAGAAQNTETKAQHWDWATQWSMPKEETLGIVVPGLFGYKMDTPKDMMPQLKDFYQGGVYWGGVGRDPAIDRYIDGGRHGDQPSGFMRFSGGGNYCGILVVLLAVWAVAQSLRKKNSPYADAQKKMIWFWTVVLIGSLLLAWGRFAPIFYGTLYHLPYFSTIRNPAKFIIFFSWAMVILFAYGVHALSQRHLSGAAAKSAGALTQLQNWWARTNGFDRRWTLGCLVVFGASVAGWLMFAGQQKHFAAYLQKMGFPDETTAQQIAAFSVGQVGWFVVLLAVALGLVTLVISGYFSGPRARLGAVLLGAFLIFDLGRADLPFVIHWDYKQKYEVGSLNPIVAFLRDKPYEHRVTGLPFRAPEGMELFDQLYRIEWMQHHFLYYNIQCLDIIQMPRVPEDLKAYLEALSPRGTAESARLLARHWQLTNTRYLLGPAGFLDVMNRELDPVQKRFRIVQRFEVVPKPGIQQPTQLEELTAVPNDNGRYALFEFTGALPRAKLYSTWQVSTNDPANLKTLANPEFDPEKTVLISTPEKNLPDAATNENSGTVEFQSYSPKQLVFTAHAVAPSVLLLNDRYDPNWTVRVDNKPAQLLRCNYIMRGVYLPAGQHTVEFQFRLPNGPLKITLAAIATGLVLIGLLIFLSRRKPAPQP